MKQVITKLHMYFKESNMLVDQIVTHTFNKFPCTL